MLTLDHIDRLAEDNVIREGDHVLIPPGIRPVRRVGYPLVPSEVTDVQLAKEYPEVFGSNILSYEEKSILHEALQRMYCVKHRYGGNTRSVYFENKEIPPGEYRVLNVRTKCEGKRTVTSEGEFGEYTGVYFTQTKRHKVLLVEPVPSSNLFSMFSKPEKVMASSCIKLRKEKIERE